MSSTITFKVSPKDTETKREMIIAFIKARGSQLYNAMSLILDAYDIKTLHDVAMIPERYPILYNALVEKYSRIHENHANMSEDLLIDTVEMLLFTAVTSPYNATSYTPRRFCYAFFGVADRIFLAKEYMRVLRETKEQMTQKQMSEYMLNHGHENDLRDAFTKQFADVSF